MTIPLIIWVYAILALFYVLLFVAFHYFWFISKVDFRVADFNPQVSLLIAVRNEEKNLPSLFAAINKLNYPGLEVIFVDDHSTDETLNMLRNVENQQKNINQSWVVLNAQNKGKKAAIQQAVNAAKGDIIVTTDADCTFESEWIEQMVAPFSAPNVQLVAGPVITKLHSNRMFGYFQQIEWASILLVTRLSFGLGVPFMCSAANLSYRKATFLALKGYEGNMQYLSGDDEFLLKKILAEFGPTATTYLNQPAVLVQTLPQINWYTFLMQRARWASKWKLHSLHHAFIAAGPFLLQLAILASPLLLICGLPGVWMFLVFWFSKVTAEWIVVRKMLHKYDISLPLLGFIYTSQVYALYVLCTAYFTLVKKWEWKGRRQA